MWLQSGCARGRCFDRSTTCSGVSRPSDPTTSKAPAHVRPLLNGSTRGQGWTFGKGREEGRPAGLELAQPGDDISHDVLEDFILLGIIAPLSRPVQNELVDPHRAISPDHVLEVLD